MLEARAVPGDFTLCPADSLKSLSLVVTSRARRVRARGGLPFAHIATPHAVALLTTQAILQTTSRICEPSDLLLFLAGSCRFATYGSGHAHLEKIKSFGRIQ